MEVECPKSPKRQSNRTAKGFSEVPLEAEKTLSLSLYNKREYALIST
ncbi:hypothetical protein POREN0001_0402 [Porphyromonas endodontalis ATCC 35406]|uniref:Uncharacterized protein n=1 Tax=Porphyromonas endodontalis (strain ATCC 35406 / DSM 24491 / JCM 8526 / CCUG 16442 / BCRC 14492 / NCTC 13058 / HG 370) TaxID=553175 RepID=C3JB11_POREA|nr:hypothetical protein POREN0001_0402 [Porphyromonas endodontalis ATCC 35406]